MRVIKYGADIHFDIYFSVVMQDLITAFGSVGLLVKSSCLAFVPGADKLIINPTNEINKSAPILLIKYQLCTTNTHKKRANNIIIFKKAET